jgi:cytochrome d ubiquinol oxidase subunit I
MKLAHAWAKGAAVLFAVGAVSGTVLSFQLGLLFPGFMLHAGAVIGMPFSLEGVAFFTEAIFLGVWLYGWDRVSPRAHIAAGFGVAASGLTSAVFILFANAWMNHPVGFSVGPDGTFTDIRPLAVFGNPFAIHEILHMALAAYMATAWAAAGISAIGILRGRGVELHRRALGVALALAIPASIIQPLVGHWSGHRVAVLQPMKLAAIEQLIHTQSHAPVTVGPLKVPSGLSLLAFDSPSATVHGLEEIPRQDWPTPAVRWSFQLMVLTGTLLAGVAALAVFLRWRKKTWEQPWFLKLVAAMAPLGFIALEAGWCVTELGRQPWVIYGVVRTRDAASPIHGLAVPLVTFALVYAVLSAIVIRVVRRQVQAT